MTVFSINATFSFIKKENEGRMTKLPYSRFHPFLPFQCSGTEAGGIDVGRAIAIPSSVFYYSLDGSLLQPSQNILSWEQWVWFDISLGQMALLIANNILGPRVDLQVISLLPSSHSFRICWYNLFIQCKLIEDHHLPRISQGAGGILMITVGALKELSLGGKPTLARGMHNLQLSQEVVLEECKASLSLQHQQRLPWVSDTRTEWKAQMGSLEPRCPDSF